MPEIPPTPEARFAIRTRELRRAIAWSQSRLADQIAAVGGPRLDPSNVARLERGDRRITLDEAFAIADALGSTLESLVGDGLNSADRERLAEIHAAEEALADAQQRLDRARSRRGTVTGVPLTDAEADAAAVEPHSVAEYDATRDGADQ